MVICFCLFFFFNGTSTTEIYPYCHTLSLPDALPIFKAPSRYSPTADAQAALGRAGVVLDVMVDADVITQAQADAAEPANDVRSEEHTSELQSLMRTSYAVFCLKKKTKKH